MRSSAGLPLTLAVCAATMTIAAPVARAEPPQCLSMDPQDWPPAARPYFLLMVSTSTSMSTNVAGNLPATCTGQNNTSYGIDRRAHARCALKTTVEAYADEVNFGLATLARTISGCSDDGNGLCNYNSCTHANLTGSADMSCPMNIGCGPEPMPAAPNSASRAGAFFRVAVPSQPGNAPSNLPALVAWLDGSCADSRELFASGCMPANGMLRDAFRYFSDQWKPPTPVPGGPPLFSPLTSLVNGERPCRTVHAILITDTGESCDVANDAVDAAADLYAGFMKDGIQWSIKTHVINFAGANIANADAIAAAGGTGTSFLVQNEAELTATLAAILDPAVKTETCDNADNDCNGCTDEGFAHYCHQALPCCAWNTQAQRTACLAQYQTSLPDGDPKLLPCTTPAQQMNGATWLCIDPDDLCDGVDNNCSAGTDEGCVGAACLDAAACSSGFCVDGVCCDAACGDGAADDCTACSVAAGAPSDGTCAPLAPGSACADGDACTLVDTCQDGVCVGADPIECPPASACQEAPTCAPDLGTCDYATKPDDSPCEDDDPCTQDDVCAAGTCVAGPPKACNAVDDCHDAGACDPQTGACSEPIKPDDSPCGDGGTCSNGVCTGSLSSGPDSSSGATPTDAGSTGTGDTTSTGTASTPTGGGVSHGLTEHDTTEHATGTGGGSGTPGTDSGASTGSGETSSGADGCGCRSTRAPHGMLLTLVLAAAWRRRPRTSSSPA